MSQPLDKPRGQWRVFPLDVSDAAKPLSVLANLGRDSHLTDGFLQVLDNDVYFGDRESQPMELIESTSMGFDFLPLGEVWVKNFTPGSTARVRICGFIHRGEM